MVATRQRDATRARSRLREDLYASVEASSLVEFAIALPLLMVLVVGIFDFGGAFNQKQELNTAVREGARFGASQPTNDLASGTAPPSIDAIRYLVDNYLLNSNINDCGLGATGLPLSGPPWTYQTTGTCAGQLTLTIKKDPEIGASSPNTPFCGLQTAAGSYGSPNPLPKSPYLACTSVQISYPYQWHFNSVIQVLIPGSTIALTQIQTNATVPNMN
jgi:hypothetical protein